MAASPPGRGTGSRWPGAREAAGVAHQDLAAPDGAVGAVAGAVHDQAHGRAGQPVLGLHRRQVGVVVLHADQSLARPACSPGPAGADVAGMQVVGDDRGPALQHVLQGADGLGEELARPRRFARSPMWGLRKARPSLSRQTVFFSSGPTARTGWPVAAIRARRPAPARSRGCGGSSRGPPLDAPGPPSRRPGAGCPGRAAGRRRRCRPGARGPRRCRGRWARRSALPLVMTRARMPCAASASNSRWCSGV